jgi:hypothetical protein
MSGLQLTSTPSSAVDSDGFPEGGSRIFQWGWAPIGGSRANDVGLTPNGLAVNCLVGTVTIT